MNGKGGEYGRRGVRMRIITAERYNYFYLIFIDIIDIINGFLKIFRTSVIKKLNQ